MKTFVYVPDDLFALFPKQDLEGFSEPALSDATDRPFLVRPAAPREVKSIQLGTDAILDLACLILAAIRTGNDIESLYPVYGEGKTIFLVRLLRMAGIINEDNLPVTEVAQLFLQKERTSALLQLVQVWVESAIFNELSEIPELTVDKLFRFDPHATRRQIISALSNTQGTGWLSFQGFSAAIRQEWPEFLRDQSENTAWLIRNSVHSAFRDWENIEAVYLRYLLNGPCFWLGLVDISAPARTQDGGEQDISAFRVNWYGRKVLAAVTRREPLTGVRPSAVEKQPPSVTIDGRIMVGRAVSRILRYHIARFCEWEKIQPDRWQFRITPLSLRKAKNASLKVRAFLNMLKRACGNALPGSLTDAITQWDQSDTQATMFEATVLTVTNPDWVVTLLNSKDSSKWIERQLNANTLLIKPKGEDAVRRVLIEIGVLTDKQM